MTRVATIPIQFLVLVLTASLTLVGCQTKPGGKDGTDDPGSAAAPEPMPELARRVNATTTRSNSLIPADAPRDVQPDAKVSDRPNILVIWGDDVGSHNISAYSHGMMGYETPNIDKLAREGGMFTHAYAQQSCTAGRASFVLGQHPFRTGLLTIGMPGSDHGIPDWAPTIADFLKDQGYMTAQFGKNHLGDQDKHLPTVHGFDEFFGNLYHLNAEEEPETYYYPKDKAFHERFGPRGVIKSNADGTIEDTGPLTRKRMETADQEFVDAGLDFMRRAKNDNKPFFMWMTTTRMHVWTHLKKESEGVTGIGLYPDGMVEHDKQIGMMLDELKKLGIADNTIVIYSTDNGAETFTWPDGGIIPYTGEKGTTWEGGFRVPLVVRWPGVVPQGVIYNDMVSHEDWLPTLLAAAGRKDVVGECKKGCSANGKDWKVHLDGHDITEYLAGREQVSPRDSIFYFGQGGELNAVRWNDWKVHFATLQGNIATGVREEQNWPLVVNLRADPYEHAIHEADLGYMRWYGDNMWLFVPIQAKITDFLLTLPDYPFQEGNSLSAGGINYRSLKAYKALQLLETLAKDTGMVH